MFYFIDKFKTKMSENQNFQALFMSGIIYWFWMYYVIMCMNFTKKCMQMHLLLLFGC